MRGPLPPFCRNSQADGKKFPRRLLPPAQLRQAEAEIFAQGDAPVIAVIQARRCSSGITRWTKSSNAPGRWVIPTTNPSQARSTSYCSNWSARSLTLPTTASSANQPRLVSHNALLGHEQRSPRLGLSGCFRFDERTFARERVDVTNAPIADLHSTRAWGMPLSWSYAASLCLCIGLQLAMLLNHPLRSAGPRAVGVIERG